MRSKRKLSDFTLGIIAGIGISLIAIGGAMRWMSKNLRKHSK